MVMLIMLVCIDTKILWQIDKGYRKGTQIVVWYPFYKVQKSECVSVEVLFAAAFTHFWGKTEVLAWYKCLYDDFASLCDEVV